MELIIKGALIYDGTGDAPYSADVGISGGKIAEIGRLTQDADLVLFDEKALTDRADYADPFKPNEGITAVFVGGDMAVSNNTVTGVRNGNFIIK